LIAAIGEGEEHGGGTFPGRPKHRLLRMLLQWTTITRRVISARRVKRRLQKMRVPTLNGHSRLPGADGGATVAGKVKKGPVVARVGALSRAKRGNSRVPCDREVNSKVIACVGVLRTG